jgi:CDP-glycerol glycerophosphotransferase
MLAAIAATPPVLGPDTLADMQARLDQLESFGSQVSGAIESLVGSLVELQADAKETQALQSKLKEMEQQLAVERSCRDLERVSHMHAKVRRIVFVGTSYLGCNVKYAWLAALERAAEEGFDCWFLPSSATQEEQVRSVDARVFPSAWTQWSSDHLHTALATAVVVTSDHLLNPNPFASALLAGARHVQLWHGVSIKEIGLRNLLPLKSMNPRFARILATCGPYASLVGTAAGHESEWRRWFGFERYAPLGYVRNDVLYREPAGADLLNVDPDAYALACQTRAKGKRVILYAPTWRDGKGAAWMLQAGLERIAQGIAANGDCLIVNLHPVEAPQVDQLRPHLPGVGFVKPRTDIYPLLTQTSVLVTDYSSVMFDYLHLDRPILLYRPDHEEYTQRSRKLFDDKLTTLPGPMLSTADSLLHALKKLTDGHHAAERQTLRAQLFDHHDGGSGERLLAWLSDELSQVTTHADD